MLTRAEHTSLHQSEKEVRTNIQKQSSKKKTPVSILSLLPEARIALSEAAKEHRLSDSIALVKLIRLHSDKIEPKHVYLKGHKMKTAKINFFICLQAAEKAKLMMMAKENHMSMSMIASELILEYVNGDFDKK